MAPTHAATPVELSRIAREHRAVLVPLAIVLILNLIALILVVLPLSQRVSSNEARATAAERAQATANVEFTRAEAARTGTARASTDLDTFYDKILPADITAARRMTHIRFQQKAREHGVRYQRGSMTEEQIKDSPLSRLSVSISLAGEYDDIRALLFELENSDDFFVINNVSLAESGQTGDPLAVALEVSTYFRTARAAGPSGGDGR